MERQLIVNRAQCLKCGDVLISKHRHDFVSCRCLGLFVDGGTEYLQSLIDYKELHEQTTDVHYFAYCKENEYREKCKLEVKDGHKDI